MTKITWSSAMAWKDIARSSAAVMRSSPERSGILYGKYHIWIRPSHVYRARVQTFRYLHFGVHWSTTSHEGHQGGNPAVDTEYRGQSLAFYIFLHMLKSPKRIVVDIIVSNRVWLFWTLIVTCSQGGYRVKPVISNLIGINCRGCNFEMLTSLEICIIRTEIV